MPRKLNRKLDGKVDRLPGHQSREAAVVEFADEDPPLAREPGMGGEFLVLPGHADVKLGDMALRRQAPLERQVLFQINSQSAGAVHYSPAPAS